jgi:multiple sugar transport system permease protein
MTIATEFGTRGGILAERNLKYVLIAPAVFIILLIGLYPILHSLVVSFQDVSALFKNYDFVGFMNYGRLFGDGRLWYAMLHTLIITAIALPLELVLGLLMAQLFLEKMPLRQLMVALAIIPSVLSPVVVGASWRLMFDDRFGPINAAIRLLFDERFSLPWVISPIAVYPALLITEVWQWTPFMFLMLYAALSNVDQSLEEAAKIDGAGYWTIFFKIALPSIWPVMAIALIIRALDLVRIFDIAWVLTRGGPGTFTETISIYLYQRGFRQFETSYTAAMVVMIVIVLSVVVVWFLRRMEVTGAQAR